MRTKHFPLTLQKILMKKDDPLMNSAPPIDKPCDGTIPDGWEMPDTDARLEQTKNCVRLDFRGLKAPAPLVGTLRTLETLPSETVFEGYYPQNPIHLFPALLEDGWQYSVIKEDEAGTILRIFRESSTS